MRTVVSPVQTVVGADAGAVTARHAVFVRQGQWFGLSVDVLREVLSGQTLTRVPRASRQILGVLSLRGEILPVVAVDEWLNLPSVADDPSLPILVLRRDDLLVGLRVDAIQSVMSVPMHEVQPHPSASPDSLAKGIWHPEGSAPIALIAGQSLLDTLCRELSLKNTNQSN